MSITKLQNDLALTSLKATIDAYHNVGKILARSHNQADAALTDACNTVFKNIASAYAHYSKANTANMSCQAKVYRDESIQSWNNVSIARMAMELFNVRIQAIKCEQHLLGC